MRFRFWRACVLTFWLLVPAAFIAAACSADLVRAVEPLLLAADVAMAWLLLTTPANAIRLPPRRSVRYVTLGTAWLLAVSWACFERTPPAAVVAIALVAVAWFSTRRLAAFRRSPWWAALGLWHPAVIGPSSDPGVAAVFGAAMLLIAAFVREPTAAN